MITKDQHTTLLQFSVITKEQHTTLLQFSVMICTAAVLGLGLELALKSVPGRCTDRGNPYSKWGLAENHYMVKRMGLESAEMNCVDEFGYQFQLLQRERKDIER